jgi:hypothetical protein
MSTQPIVSIPLSDYQDLVRRVNMVAVQDLTVGRVYDIKVEGVKDIYQCKSKADKTFHLVSSGFKIKHIEITLNENL